jgi:flagellar export protein FliJ
MTTRFTFKLQPIQRIREHAELLAMRDLAGELRHAAELHRELGDVEDRLADAQQPDIAGLSAVELAARQLYLERVERELDDARRRADAQAETVDAGRARLADAARAREVLDRLEDRRRSLHDKELRTAERVTSDELSARIRPTGLGSAA